MVVSFHCMSARGRAGPVILVVCPVPISLRAVKTFAEPITGDPRAAELLANIHRSFVAPIQRTRGSDSHRHASRKRRSDGTKRPSAPPPILLSDTHRAIPSRPAFRPFVASLRCPCPSMMSNPHHPDRVPRAFSREWISKPRYRIRRPLYLTFGVA
jgi:hypothetical protein